MRRIASLLLAAAFILPPAVAQADKVIKAEVKYLGQGVFEFRKKAYVYSVLVDALKAAHPDQHIDVVFVDMGTVATQADKAQVCQLRQALLTRVVMALNVDGEERELFCN